MTTTTTKDRSPGSLTKFVVYAVALPAMYFFMTPTVTGNFTEGHARGFRVAAARQIEDAKGVKSVGYISYSLAQVQSGDIDLTSVSFLLPQEVTNIHPDSGDMNEATVLERHPDWQLIEYRFGNTHNSTSLYRAFKDRIEPLSYRMTMHFGLFVGAIVLLIPVWIVSALINAIWNAIAGRKKSSDAS